MTITNHAQLVFDPAKLQYNRRWDQEQLIKAKAKMSRFQRVNPSQAGPAALGILLPPGRRTLVLLRPRSLDWDLVPLRPDEIEGSQTPFWEVDRDEGSAFRIDSSKTCPLPAEKDIRCASVSAGSC